MTIRQIATDLFVTQSGLRYSTRGVKRRVPPEHQKGERPEWEVWERYTDIDGPPSYVVVDSRPNDIPAPVPQPLCALTFPG